MQRVPRILVSTFFGLLFCSLLSMLVFSVGSILDGTRAGEALAIGVVAGVAAGFFGALVGMIVGIADLGPRGGALVGLLAAAGAVAFYVLTFSRPNQYGYFLGESGIILIVLGLPAILTGVLTAVVKDRVSDRS